MDYNALLELVTDLGYQLGMCGAETYRIEESANRIMQAYGINAEAFAIPNCLHVSIETAEGKPMTRMRRIGMHGNDIDSLEQFYNLSRRICAEKPDPQVAKQWLKNTERTLRHYSYPSYLLGNFLGGAGFSILFGGHYLDAIWGGICGIVIGIVSDLMDKLKANNFFKIISATFLMACFAYLFNVVNISVNTDAVIIGALMILVPGWLFTNGIRDIIYGDTNSGIHRIVQVFLVAIAIALGTGAAWNLFTSIFGESGITAALLHPLWLELIACFLACIGFAILFNIHGLGVFVCAAGGTLTWLTYRVSQHYGVGDVTANLIGAMVASMYSELMARIRKYPAITYLVISLFPLIPGAGVYYSVNYAVRGDMANFAIKLGNTGSVAGAMAVGILLVSTAFRILTDRLSKRRSRNI
ncbi:MAG: threonine/serine exporter family protein [Oscillospiraceae bacterium]|nr:threonine/serine exporter family protein [Oscillospiraceae bacterium]